jgi:HK97 family phage prohead protease
LPHRDRIEQVTISRPQGRLFYFGRSKRMRLKMRFKDADAVLTKDTGSEVDGDSISDGGAVCGYASTWDREPDSYGEVVVKGAFAESLAHWAQLNADGRYIPLLFAHNREDPKHNIGLVKVAREDERGLYIEAEFDANNEKAQYVRKLVKEGRLYQFSFGYHVREGGWAQIDKKDVYELRKLDLLEVSLVQVPANQHAEVTEVKDAGIIQTKAGRRNSKKDENALRDLVTQIDAMRESILALIGDDDEDVDDGKGAEFDTKDSDDAQDEQDEQDASDEKSADELGQKSAEGGEGEQKPEGHEVDEKTRLEAYRTAILSGLR